MHKHHPQPSLRCQEIVTYLQMELYSVEFSVRMIKEGRSAGLESQNQSSKDLQLKFYVAPGTTALWGCRFKITLGRAMWRRTSNTYLPPFWQVNLRQQSSLKHGTQAFVISKTSEPRSMIPNSYTYAAFLVKMLSTQIQKLRISDTFESTVGIHS